MSRLRRPSRNGGKPFLIPGLQSPGVYRPRPPGSLPGPPRSRNPSLHFVEEIEQNRKSGDRLLPAGLSGSHQDARRLPSGATSYGQVPALIDDGNVPLRACLPRYEPRSRGGVFHPHDPPVRHLVEQFVAEPCLEAPIAVRDLAPASRAGSGPHINLGDAGFLRGVRGPTSIRREDRVGRLGGPAGEQFRLAGPRAAGHAFQRNGVSFAEDSRVRGIASRASWRVAGL